MTKKIALILITHFKPAWSKLSEEEQAGFAARVSRAAKQAGVTAVVGYTLTTPGSTMEIWEADDKASLETFKLKLDALGYKTYYDEIVMVGERAAEWIHMPALETSGSGKK